MLVQRTGLDFFLSLLIRLTFIQGAIAEAGGIKALVDLIFKWPRGGDGVLVRALIFLVFWEPVRVNLHTPQLIPWGPQDNRWEIPWWL